MSVEIKAPHFPESVEDGTLMKWYKAEGDAVQQDEKLADIETDKVVLEVAAPSTGTLSRILKQEGDTVLNDEVIAELGGEAPAESSEEASADGAAEEPAQKPEAPAEKSESSDAPASSDLHPAEEPDVEPDMDGIGPAARHLIMQNNLDPEKIAGTGRNGRITKKDVVNFMEAGSTPAPAPAQAPPAAPQAQVTVIPPQPSAPQLPSIAEGRPEERVPMSRLRRRIAERLVQAQHNAAILTTFNEVNMQPIMDLRSRLKDRFQNEYGVKLGFMSFFIKAAVEALKKFPVINASVEGQDVIYHGFYDVGVAVSTERGLVVPILRDADRMSFAEIEAGIIDYAKRANERKLELDELQGGTFTITNGGVFGSMLSTPIVNPPQSGILGMHTITERPVAEDGKVVIRPVMYIALSYDHRIIDGREAVLFLVSMKEILEDPARLLLEV